MMQESTEAHTESLTEERLLIAVSKLCEQDSTLRVVVEKWGPPPLWDREPGFPTLVHIILEQQVSLASAKACFDKLAEHVEALTPQRFLTLHDTTLLEIGFSRQKTRYCRILSQAIVDETLDLAALHKLPDGAVYRELTSLTGIGAWTANIYLLMALGRPNIWPPGDLALIIAMKELFMMDERPDHETFQEKGERWKPYRAVAARILWHYYLSR